MNEEGAAIIAADIIPAVDDATAALAVKEKPKQRRTHIKHDVIISKQMESPPIRSGTNRYRNMEVVMQCHTVGEALAQLKALEHSPGGGTDIKLAEKAGAITLLHPTG